MEVQLPCLFAILWQTDGLVNEPTDGGLTEGSKGNLHFFLVCIIPDGLNMMIVLKYDRKRQNQISNYIGLNPIVFFICFAFSQI